MNPKLEECMANVRAVIAAMKREIEARKLEAAAHEAAVDMRAIIEAHKDHPCWKIDDKGMN